MLLELNKKINKLKMTKGQCFLNMIKDNFLFERDKLIQLSNKYKPNNVPRYEDRTPIAMKLYNYCLENGFSLYKNIHFICDLINTPGYTDIALHKVSWKKHIVPFTLKKLEKYNKKLFKKIIANPIIITGGRMMELEKSDLILLGLSNYLSGVMEWQKNGLFRYEQITFKGKTVYYGIVKKGDKITNDTFREIKYFGCWR